ncbi:MAG: class I SAM-dependent methyltransferase [Armatimonadetes bacterium]|nr:class I SAM-dependent methyltransferase [Armatimonadota bacterium]
MENQLSSRITEYFSRDDAASQWWNIDSKTGGRYGKQIQFIRKNVSIKNLTALDVATGLGRFAIDFAKSGANKVVGIDISASMIEKAKNNALQENTGDKIEFKVGNAADLNLTANSFDVISLMEVLVHLPDPVSVIKNLSNYLKPNGIFITNYDYPRAPKVTYPIDTMVALTRGILRRKFKRDTVMLSTVDETIGSLEKSKNKEVKFMRPKDAYRGLTATDVNQMLKDAGLVIIHEMSEFPSVGNIVFPISIGKMVIAQKR